MRGFSSSVKQLSKRRIGVAPVTHVPSRQAERTEANRRKLLAAAERIFARDGFEAARLEDIAAGAGYTRGAFYANYGGKEEIFFALLEQWVRQRIDSVTAVLRRQKSPQQKLAALRKLFAELMQALGRTLPISNPAASACCLALAQGLLLEQLVDPKTLSEEDVRHMLGVFFDSIFRGNST